MRMIQPLLDKRTIKHATYDKFIIVCKTSGFKMWCKSKTLRFFNKVKTDWIRQVWQVLACNELLRAQARNHSNTGNWGKCRFKRKMTGITAQVLTLTTEVKVRKLPTNNATTGGNRRLEQQSFIWGHIPVFRWKMMSFYGQAKMYFVKYTL